jgi:hypothetical protein
MSVDSERLDRLVHSGRKLADTGRLLEWGAHALHPASSNLGRLVAAVSVARLGATLLPAAGRALRRHPVASLLLAAGLLGALYWAREPPRSPRPRFG